MKLIEENPNKSVITTKYVVNAHKPIVNVVYDADGDWQFYSDDKVEESDAVVLSVSQILELDPTLRMIELHERQEAVRDLVNHKWLVE